MKPRTIQLFLTPTPGARVLARVEALSRALGANGIQVILTKSGFDPLVIDEEADHVCAVGGDGTLRHVVEAARRLDRSIGASVYPVGTVNLVAKEYAYPRAPKAFASRLASGVLEERHFASVNGLPILACASIGPDSYAVEALSPRLKRWFGRSAYLIALMGLLVRWPRATMILHHDGRQTKCEAVYIAKGRFFAGPWSIAPDASGALPFLHVVALPQASRLHYLRFAWAIFRHRPQALTGVERFTCNALTIEGAPATPLQSDGDVLAHLPATIRMEEDPIGFA
jgi:diacylglycerol kinase family enzyme